ncbi:hypothetical protein GCM10022296_24390 [Secundilactobacillus similis DSM 23365 = JCM 2765]
MLITFNNLSNYRVIQFTLAAPINTDMSLKLRKTFNLNGNFI